MGKNETLIPEPAAAELDSHSANASIPEDAGYTYQRADGTVERALNAEDAINKCPVLGKLALQAPEQASVLLKLVAAGREKIAAETAPPEPPEPPAPDKPEAKPALKRTTVELTQASEPVVKPAIEPQPEANSATEQAPQSYVPAPEAVALVAEVKTVAKSPDEKFVSPRDEFYVVPADEKDAPAVQVEVIEPVAPPAVDSLFNRALDVPEPGRLEPRPIIKLAIETPAAEQTTQPMPRATSPNIESIGAVEPIVDQVTSEPIAATAETSPEPPAETSGITTHEFKLPTFGEDETIYARDAGEAEKPTELFSSAAPDNEAIVRELAEPVPVNGIPHDEQLVLRFDAETIDTYQQLVALTDTSESLEPAKAMAAPPTIPGFETLIAEQPASEEPVTLEVIQAQANEQPLEQTLGQLVEYLSAAVENREPSELLEVIGEIQAALPDCYVIEETGETKLRATPQITAKLRMLLETVGYEQPDETLVSFVRQYDLSLLLQAIEYLGRYTGEHTQEFVTATAIATDAGDETVHARLGRVLLGFLRQELVKG